MFSMRVKRATTTTSSLGSPLVVVTYGLPLIAPSFAGRVVEYDNFYPEQGTTYAQHFFRVLNATGTVALRCTWSQVRLMFQAIIECSQVGLWVKAFDDAGLYTEYNPLLEHRDISHQVTCCNTLDHRM